MPDHLKPYRKEFLDSNPLEDANADISKEDEKGGADEKTGIEALQKELSGSGSGLRKEYTYISRQCT